jgi:hypothetical protein
MALTKEGRWVTASGQSSSSGLKLVTETLVGFYTPAALDAVKLKLQASSDGQSFVDIVTESGVMIRDVAINQFVAVDPTKLLGAAYMRVVHLNSGGSAVNESAERVIRPVFRAFE